jgi:hypothetical protein
VIFATTLITASARIVMRNHVFGLRYSCGLMPDLRFILLEILRLLIQIIKSCNMPIGQRTEQYNRPKISVAASSTPTISTECASSAGKNCHIEK